MGRASTKENKNRYQLVREELGLSRERASELLETIQTNRESVMTSSASTGDLLALLEGVLETSQTNENKD